jgi:hypothetical protein
MTFFFLVTWHCSAEIALGCASESLQNKLIPIPFSRASVLCIGHKITHNVFIIVYAIMACYIHICLKKERVIYIERESKDSASLTSRRFFMSLTEKITSNYVQILIYHTH